MIQDLILKLERNKRQLENCKCCIMKISINKNIELIKNKIQYLETQN